MPVRVKKTSTEITREILLREVGNARPFYEWVCAHVTQEFSIGPIRVGGVEGLRPFTDERLRDCLRSAGVKNCEKAPGWLNQLSRIGLVAVPSLDGGIRRPIIVIGSNGRFTDEPVELPRCFIPSIKKALKHLGRRVSIGEFARAGLLLK